jgi:hypothetical protein
VRRHDGIDRLEKFCSIDRWQQSRGAQFGVPISDE